MLQGGTNDPFGSRGRKGRRVEWSKISRMRWGGGGNVELKCLYVVLPLLVLIKCWHFMDCCLLTVSLFSLLKFNSK